MTDLQHAIAIAMMEERAGYEIDLVPLARVIRAELNRQNREYHDHLNAAATIDPRSQPEPQLVLTGGNS